MLNGIGAAGSVVDGSFVDCEMCNGKSAIIYVWKSVRPTKQVVEDFWLGIPNDN